MTVEQVFREEWGNAVGILTRALGDLELAEDAVQDAFTTALERWPRDGSPRNPGAWIVTTARNRAIDRIRRDRVYRQKTELLARLEELPEDEDDVSAIPDERLALVFTCCHPALASEARAFEARAPDDPSRAAASGVRAKLDELASALEADRSLRLSAPPPTQEQLAYSTALIRQQAEELQGTIRPPEPGQGSGWPTR